jgi:Phosphotransferase enzyme family
LLAGTFAGSPGQRAELLVDLRTVRSGGHLWRGEELLAVLAAAGYANVGEVPRQWTAPVAALRRAARRVDPLPRRSATLAAVDEEVLAGGVANAGAVIRSGQHVLRPANPHSASIHRLLAHLRATGFDGASEPVGIDPDGRERLVFIEGVVPVPPYAHWAQTDTALASIAGLMRRLHEAALGFDGAGATWSTEMADPHLGSGTGPTSEGGLVVCHNDVCLENVVFRDGAAVGLLDFDFAAPGRPSYDVAQMTRMCTPVDDPLDADRLGWRPDAAAPERVRLVADAYGLGAAGRRELLDALDGSIAHGGEFVRRRVEAGEAAFVAMWESMGGMARFDRRREWWAGVRHGFAAALH